MGVWLISVIGLTFLNWSDAFRGQELPCTFFESINITDGDFQNGAVTFQGVKFNKNQFAQVNYIYINGEKQTAKPHYRGCICKLKPCIRLCCPLGSVFDPNVPNKCRIHEAANKLESVIINSKNEFENVSLIEHFAIVHDRPCKNIYMENNYNISQSGQITYEEKILKHHHYCLKTGWNETTEHMHLDLLVCFDVSDPPATRFVLLPYCMLISVPFIIATMIVYIALPELRNLHGKCLLGYLIGLVIGYSCLAWFQLNYWSFVDPVTRKTLGYIIYFSLLSSFLWLNVISFDLWWSFRATKGLFQFPEKKRFYLYMLYAWGLSSFITLFVYILDQIDVIPESFQPHIGEETGFLPNDAFLQFIYFYLPQCLICTCNIVFFVLTAFKIRQVQQDVKRITSKEGSSRHQNKLSKDKDSFTLYLRLFIIMGVTWIMEGISFFISPESMVFLLPDILNTIQGLLIFVLFVVKRRVFRLIKKRWNGCFLTPVTNGSVTTNISTTCATNIAMNQITSASEKSRKF